MLVLTRKLQERIRIGEQITLTVLKVKGNSVRLGIEAPREVRVVRAELPPHGASDEAGVDASRVEEPADDDPAELDWPTTFVGAAAACDENLAAV